MVGGIDTQLDDMISSKNLSIGPDAPYYLQAISSFPLGETFGSWYYVWETPHKSSIDLDRFFDYHWGKINMPLAPSFLNDH